MILDFDDPDVAAEHSAEVCIVGTGPAGLALAGELRGRGADVVLLESGGLVADPAVNVLNEGGALGLPVGLEEGRARTFGGTGTVWTGQCIRLDEHDFEVRDWVPDSGWPFSAADLEPHYARAGAWMGIPADAYDDEAWRRFGLTPPPFDPAELTNRSSVYPPARDVGATALHDVTASTDVRVLLHATAARVLTGDGRQATGVEFHSLGGRVGHVRAGTVVLCAGGIENARLLLLSGLGNDHDVVGRYFQEHPTFWVDVATDRPDVLQRFYAFLGRGRIRYTPKLVLSPTAQRRERLLNAVATPVYDRVDSPGVLAARALSRAVQERRRPEGLDRRQLRAALVELPRVVRAGLRRFLRGLPSADPVERVRLKVLLEQAPHRDSRITLSDRTDALGLRRVDVDWRLTDLERRTARHFTHAVDAELRRTGIGRLTGTEWLDDDTWTTGFEDAYHPMGTTRMSVDPATGVVDADCRVHGVPGLYVCGSSVFPTSGYANPTLTIVALALRLADHLGDRVARGRTPRERLWT